MKALAFAFLLFALTPIDIDTSKIENGAHVTYKNDAYRTVTLSKNADVTTVLVTEGERVDTLIVRNIGGKTVIAHSDNGIPRAAGILDRAPILVDGMNVEPFLQGDAVDRSVRGMGMATYYTCPKDRAMLRVPNGSTEAMFKCPVDGTLMRPGVGPSRQFYLLN